MAREAVAAGTAVPGSEIPSPQRHNIGTPQPVQDLHRTVLPESNFERVGPPGEQGAPAYGQYPAHAGNFPAQHAQAPTVPLFAGSNNGQQAQAPPAGGQQNALGASPPGLPNQ